ncbi:cyclin-dependent kinase 11A-like [Anoplopoma fimbria]|uniref:cyclin-dependent kinase 11A-like n=1 Tax=Anoplopoma fimbria TaxID=229290 RepID=UPI0023ECD16D|nr:cyclin-dependent kinase 11A-like [Anoplopoma fimbria]
MDLKKSKKKIEQEKRRKLLLINEHNRLTFAVNKKEAKLKELEESLKAKNLQPTNYNNEEESRQRIRQLENNMDKMKIKFIEAREIQTAYQHIREHLQQEVRGMYWALDQKEHAIAVAQAEVDRANKQFQSAAANADSTLYRVVQMEDETMRMKREMDTKICQLTAEEKALKRQMETLEHLSPTGQSRQKEREIEEEEEQEEEKEEEAHLVPVTDHQCHDVCGASQSDMKLVEEMEALREALGYAEVQEAGFTKSATLHLHVVKRGCSVGGNLQAHH